MICLLSRDQAPYGPSVCGALRASLFDPYGPPPPECAFQLYSGGEGYCVALLSLLT
jgi:hypothetical protein